MRNVFVLQSYVLLINVLKGSYFGKFGTKRANSSENVDWVCHFRLFTNKLNELFNFYFQKSAFLLRNIDKTLQNIHFLVFLALSDSLYSRLCFKGTAH